MDVYKHFLAGLKNVTLSSVYLILSEEHLSSNLLNYVKLLTALTYEDGSHHTYFGEIKRLVDSFNIYWAESMDVAVKEADRFSNLIDKETLLNLIKNTMNVRQNILQVFDELFLPIKTLEEQRVYDDLNQKSIKHLEGLEEFKAEVERQDKKSDILEIAKVEVPKSVEKKYEVFTYAYTYIAMLLADKLPEIRGSLLEILRRLRCNKKKVQEESGHELNILIDQLYDKHKEQLMQSRMDRGATKDAAEVFQLIDLIDENLKISSDIQKLRQKVIKHSEENRISALEEEEKYFASRFEEFEQIANTLNKLKAELETVERDEALYKSMIMTELPGTKYKCWENMGRLSVQRKESVKEKTIQAARALVTFFSVRGPKHMMDTDNVGPYYVDCYGHQVYLFDSELKVLHVDCERKFKEHSQEDAHYYDKVGRYVLKDGEKIYQVLNCTSSYRLGEDTLLKKITVDCGHSEASNPECGMTIKDPADMVILPKTEPVDIKRTMNTEVVRYLWDSVGATLPLALHDVGMRRPKNPIHYLAHRLLVHKYGKTTAEHHKQKQEAEEYRAKIFKERKEKAAAESKEWKAKQVKRRKPEESDDTLERSVYNAYVATNELISSINVYHLF